MSATRRQFLAAGAGITFAFVLPRLSQGAGNYAVGTYVGGGKGLPANAWVTIHPDDSVVIQAPVSEIGQGSMTALPLILAEDMDLDWNKVRIEMSPSVSLLYGNPHLYGLMLTIAAHGVRGYYTTLRIAGAQARSSLLMAASELWKVPLAELTTEPSVVVHARSGQRMSYGELAGRIEELPEAHEPDEKELKPISQFRLIGKDVARHDIPAKVSGSADYAQNVRLPNMAFATVMRSPVLGARPLEANVKRVQKLPDVLAVKLLPDAVAVVGATMEAALKGRQELQVKWSSVPAAEQFNSEQAGQAYLAVARNLEQPGAPFERKGNIKEAFAGAAKVIERSYRGDYMYHAQMEPLCAVASFSAKEQTLEAWSGTQAPGYAVESLARAVGLEEHQVTFHRSFSGGAFGRRATHDQDWIVDAAVLSKMMNRPMKVVWTREDDIRAGRFRHMGSHFLRAALDAKGQIVGWHHRGASEDLSSMQDPWRWHALGKPPTTAMSGTGISNYNVPNITIEHLRQPNIVRTAAMYGTGSVHGRFSIESFIDEIALERGLDPYEYRRELLRSSPRGLRVLEHVAKMAHWGQNEPGRAKGIAYSEFHSYFAIVAEVSVDRSSGAVKVHRLWGALDAGVIIQPRNTDGLMHSGLVMGTSFALNERISIVNGRVEQSSFADYPVLRMQDAPETFIDVLPSDGPPTGAGDISGIIVPAVIANAFAALTGRRVRHMPLTPERVLAALA